MKLLESIFSIDILSQNNIGTTFSRRVVNLRDRWHAPPKYFEISYLLESYLFYSQQQLKTRGAQLWRLWWPSLCFLWHYIWNSKHQRFSGSREKNTQRGITSERNNRIENCTFFCNCAIELNCVKVIEEGFISRALFFQMSHRSGVSVYNLNY